MTNIVIVFHFQFFTFALLCAVLCCYMFAFIVEFLIIAVEFADEKRGELVDVDKIEIAGMKFTSTNSTQSD